MASRARARSVAVSRSAAASGSIFQVSRFRFTCFFGLRTVSRPYSASGRRRAASSKQRSSSSVSARRCRRRSAFSSALAILASGLTASRPVSTDQLHSPRIACK
ncbi:MAG: hypothetical protein ABSA16_13400 [Thermoguttaceae bacterium]